MPVTAYQPDDENVRTEPELLQVKLDVDAGRQQMGSNAPSELRVNTIVQPLLAANGWGVSLGYEKEPMSVIEDSDFSLGLHLIIDCVSTCVISCNGNQIGSQMKCDTAFESILQKRTNLQKAWMKCGLATVDIDPAVFRILNHIEESRQVFHFQLFRITVKRAEYAPICTQTVNLDLDNRCAILDLRRQELPVRPRSTRHQHCLPPYMVIIGSETL